MIKLQYWILSLEAYREKLYAFPIVTYMLTTEEIPEPYHSEQVKYEWENFEV